jgi:nucleoside-diphosphate-sugar epimerase
MPIVVIGGAGFIGSHLVAPLDDLLVHAGEEQSPNQTALVRPELVQESRIS